MGGSLELRSLSAGDAVMLAALASGATQKEAARQAGVAPKTVYRRMQDPALVAELERLRASALDAITTALGSAATMAVATLVDLVEGATSESVRLQAARTVLDQYLRHHEAVEVERRIQDIERDLYEPDDAWQVA